MIMTIHSKFGVLECEPMKLQAIENSILAEAENDTPSIEVVENTEASVPMDTEHQPN